MGTEEVRELVEGDARGGRVMAGLSFKMCSGAAEAGGVCIRNGGGGIVGLKRGTSGRLATGVASWIGERGLEWGFVDRRHQATAITEGFRAKGRANVKDG